MPPFVGAFFVRAAALFRPAEFRLRLAAMRGGRFRLPTVAARLFFA
jgi:hypothetical protein